MKCFVYRRKTEEKNYFDHYLYQKFKEEEELLFKNIKQIIYNSNTIFILLKNNEIYFTLKRYHYFCNRTETHYFFTKAKIKNNENILHFESSSEFTIFVNDLNEFYCNGIFSNICNTCTNWYNDKYVFIEISEIKFTKEIKFIRCGNSFLFIVTKNNKLFGFGENKDGALGLKEKDGMIYKEIKKIKGLNYNGIKDLQCNSHSILLDNNGILYVTGKNDCGQLGLGDLKNRYEFTKVNLKFKVKKITCNKFNTLILNEFNELFYCGKKYKISLFGKDNYLIFTKIVIKDKIVNIYKSFGDNLMVGTNRNDLYVIGKIYEEVLFDTSKPKEFTKFTKYFTTSELFVLPILCNDSTFFITSNEPINNNYNLQTCQKEYFVNNLLKKIVNEQLNDISFNFTN